MKGLMLKNSFELISNHNYISCDISREIYYVIRESKQYYPQIFDWYLNKFIAGIYNGSRKILLYYVGKDIAGIALLKNDVPEKKICTFRIDGRYRNSGIGKRLLEKSLEILNTNKPMITVPGKRVWEFDKILRYYDFKLDQIVQGYYRENSSEYVFNGHINSENTYKDLNRQFLWSYDNKLSYVV